MKLSRSFFFTLLLFSIAFGSMSACSTQPKADLQMLSMGQMPAQVQSAPVTVQEAYQFAAADPDGMKNIPCYCGCGNIGHTSNYSCYVSNLDDKGKFSFDNHALGCTICVDITQDVMRLLREGKSPQEAQPEPTSMPRTPSMAHRISPRNAFSFFSPHFRHGWTGGGFRATTGSVLCASGANLSDRGPAICLFPFRP